MSMKRIGTLIGSALAALLVVSVIQGVHAEDAMPGMKMPKATDAATKGDLAGFAEINVTGEVQQRIGVTTGKAEETPLAMNIRAVGIIRPDETKVAHIHLKTEGWVEKLFVAFTGQKLKAGDPMLSIYSPAFYAAQREFLTALRSARSNPDQQTVAETARQRLELWDVPQDAIEALEKTGKPARSLIMRTPISGTVLEKKTFEGQYAMPQAELYVVADLSTVWMQAKIFEYELPHVVVGMPVTVSFPSLPMQKFIGKVVFVDPVVDEMSRSVQVRVELPNPKGEFRPGMFGQIMLTHGMGSGLTVPTSAVIRTGGRDIAFRVTSPGRFVPVQVKISPLQFEDRFQVLEGLKAGDEVVTSANFLIDSESRLEAGGGSMVGMPGMDSGGSAPAAKPEPAKTGEEGTHEHSKTKH
ncbi:efflux RND transporter periplasmic adaptor subunit [Bradyrhizobium sp. USDA 313]|uniref:efflux RND transporter periplasmic adaptor subunit n=1 Tax=Bradyrhizobium sp. USDA 313 TaxID=3156307 RepID=UPI0035187577